MIIKNKFISINNNNDFIIIILIYFNYTLKIYRKYVFFKICYSHPEKDNGHPKCLYFESRCLTTITNVDIL